MSLASCAEITRKGDPDRFLATMAAPASMRPALFAIYAFNVEISRAAWVSKEAMICEIRLQWWAEALDEIAAGVAVHQHEVITPLADAIDGASAVLLGELIQARKWDIHGEPFVNDAHLARYLDATSGLLMWVAARATGVTGSEAAIREIGQVSGLANWFKAVPQLTALGRKPLPNSDLAAISLLAKDGLRRLKIARRGLPRSAYYAARTGWQADSTLRTVAANPAAVVGGRLHMSEFSRRSLLLWRVLLGLP